MTLAGIIVAVVVGTAVGPLGRLVVPGPQPIPIWLTIVVGIVAAYLATLAAPALDIPTVTDGLDWLEVVVQVIVAAVLVIVAANLYDRRVQAHRVARNTTRMTGPHTDPEAATSRNGDRGRLQPGSGS